MQSDGAELCRRADELERSPKAKKAKRRRWTDIKKRDDLYDSAIEVVIREGRGSCSLLQRCLGIGYGRAAKLIDFMAEDGIVGQYNGSKAREVLMTMAQWQALQGLEVDSDDEPEPEPAKKPASKSKPTSVKAQAVEEEYEEEEEEYEDDEYEYEDDDSDAEDEEEYEDDYDEEYEDYEEEYEDVT